MMSFSDIEDLTISPSPSDKSNVEPASPAILPSIRDQARVNREAKKYVRFVDNGAVELISPSSRGDVRIQNCKVPISSSDIRLDELRHIDQTIKDLKEMPDFGYSIGNFVTEDEHSARNWKLMSNYVFNSEKYQKVTHHVKLRALKTELEKKEALLKNKKLMFLRAQQALPQTERLASADYKKKLDELERTFKT